MFVAIIVCVTSSSGLTQVSIVLAHFCARDRMGKLRRPYDSSNALASQLQIGQASSDCPSSHFSFVLLYLEEFYFELECRSRRNCCIERCMDENLSLIHI